MSFGCWPLQTENLEIVLLFTAQLFTTANKKVHSWYYRSYFFLRYAISDSMTISASNRFAFHGKQILRYT